MSEYFIINFTYYSSVTIWSVNTRQKQTEVSSQHILEKFVVSLRMTSFLFFFTMLSRTKLCNLIM